MPGNWGWNVVNSVSDPRFLHNFAAHETRSMAPAMQHLYLATTGGMLRFEKNSRVVTPLSGSPFLDVTAAAGTERVLGAADDQSIVDFGDRGLGSPTVVLPAPPQPYWPMTPGTVQAGDVIANKIDSAGLLLAIKGKGIARYSLNRAPDDRFLGGRSWQLSDLSRVVLEKAVITNRGTSERTGHHPEGPSHGEFRCFPCGRLGLGG
jgi:hypothetical protein